MRYEKKILTYLLTPWSIVLLEKLAVSQLAKKFPAFYGTRKFIPTVTSARYKSLSGGSSIQSTPSNLTSWRIILILPSHLRLGLTSGSFLQVSPPKPFICLSSPPFVLIAPPNEKKTLLLNIAGDGTYSNHMCFNGLSFGLFRKPMKINWNLFLAYQFTNLIQDVIVFLAQSLACDTLSLWLKFMTQCLVALGERWQH
jgi:hypothetical protein